MLTEGYVRMREERPAGRSVGPPISVSLRGVSTPSGCLVTSGSAITLGEVGRCIGATTSVVALKRHPTRNCRFHNPADSARSH